MYLHLSFFKGFSLEAESLHFKSLNQRTLFIRIYFQSLVTLIIFNNNDNDDDDDNDDGGGGGADGGAGEDYDYIMIIFKDVRANCFCPSLLYVHANSHTTSCIERAR